MDPPLAYIPKFHGACWWLTCHDQLVAVIARDGDEVTIGIDMHRSPAHYRMADWDAAEARLLRWAEANRARLIRQVPAPQVIRSRLEDPFLLE